MTLFYFLDPPLRSMLGVSSFLYLQEDREQYGVLTSCCKPIVIYIILTDETEERSIESL